jgi:hypothetical protein
MSHPETNSPPTAEATQNISPIHLNGKAAMAAPKLSDDDHVELADMLPTGPELDPEEDIMQLARVGNIQGIEKLYDSGKFDAAYCDEEGITPLHVFCLMTITGKLSTDLDTVGSYQQPICYVPISHKSWGRCQQEGRRISCYSGNVGSAEMPLLHRASITRKWRRSARHGYPRLQHTSPSDLRREHLPPCPSSSPEHKR